MRTCLLIPAALVLVQACTAPSEPEPAQAKAAPAQQAAPVERPWTATFRVPAVLAAREVTIEGPMGLRDHVALTIDSLVHDYSVRTVPEGLLQELALKPEARGSAFVRAVLDSLQIAADERVRVLERPGDVPVVVLASGDAVWQTPDGQERRGETLRLVGEPAEQDRR